VMLKNTFMQSPGLFAWMAGGYLAGCASARDWQGGLGASRPARRPLPAISMTPAGAGG
jgi:hypothetical protein